MKSSPNESSGPKDAATSMGPNAKAVRAIASFKAYNRPNGHRKVKHSGGEMPGTAHATRARNYGKITARCRSGAAGEKQPKATYRASDGRTWRYRGKRARVLILLVEASDGITQWDTLPWHTRLGGTIHAMRRDGLDISTELEGPYRHARYRLCTPGRLLIQAKNRETNDG